MDQDDVSGPAWHLARGGKTYGPLSESDLFLWAGQGKLRPDDLLWKPGFDGWKVVSSLPGLLNPPLAPIEQDELPSNKPESQPRRGWVPLLVLMIGFVVVGGVFILIRPPTPPETPETRRAKICDQGGDRVAAMSIAREFVMRRLKVPSTAEFVHVPADYDRIRYEGDCRFKVAVVVDAENSFGAKLRARYNASLRYMPETDEWYAESVDVEGR